jgi:hypothetical protein
LIGLRSHARYFRGNENHRLANYAIGKQFKENAQKMSNTYFRPAIRSLVIALYQVDTLHLLSAAQSYH